MNPQPDAVNCNAVSERDSNSVYEIDPQEETVPSNSATAAIATWGEAKQAVAECRVVDISDHVL